MIQSELYDFGILPILNFSMDTTLKFTKLYVDNEYSSLESMLSMDAWHGERTHM